MRTVHFVTSRKTLFIGKEFGPGLMMPVTFLPSQFITNVTWFRWFADGPQSPDQVPFNGCPSCANPDTTATKHATRHARRNARARIDPPLFRPCLKIPLDYDETERDWQACLCWG